MNNKETYNLAKSFLGQGGATFRKYCGLPSGAAWCNAFVTFIFHKSGNASLYCGGKKQTYCPTSIKLCRKDMAEIPLYLAMPMDVIYFDWDRNGVPNHIGFVRGRVSTDSINTIEGNTSNKVMNKTRPRKYICGVFRPHFKASFTLKKLAIDGECGYSTIAGLQKALQILKYYNGAIDGILGQGTVKALQRWAGTSADGCWGNGTSKAVQRKIGTSADGAFGKNSVIALQKWINANAFPSVSGGTSTATKPTTPAPKPATPTRQKMSRIGHARKDYDHKAGDSSGKEVLKSKFTYSASSGSVYNWTYVFRPKDIAKANKAAEMCEKAIANNNIGYCSKGETAYGKAKAMTKLAKAAKYDLSKISVKCGCACGDLICLCNHYAGLSTCYIGSGKQLAENYKKNKNFECKKYSKGMQLYRGDVLITAHSSGKHNHVVMCL